MKYRAYYQLYVKGVELGNRRSFSFKEPNANDKRALELAEDRVKAMNRPGQPALKRHIYKLVQLQKILQPRQIIEEKSVNIPLQ